MVQQVSWSEEPTHTPEFGYEYRYENTRPSGCCGLSRESTPRRKVTTGRPDFQLPTNCVQTSKYNAYDFIPLSLLQQFKNPMNMFVLVAGALTIVPIFTTSANVPTTWITLFIIILLNVVKDYLEDKECKDRDTRENNSLTRVVRDGLLPYDVQWKDVRVGDVLEVRENEPLPADLLLYSCERGHSALVDTKNLDGETNLKSKFNCKLSYPFVVDYEGPNSAIYKFSGVARDFQGKEAILSYQNVLLRGTVLKGPKWVRGLVLYSGRETKIMMNNEGSGLKTSLVERISRRIVALLICSAVAIGFFGAGVSLASLGSDPFSYSAKDFKYFVVKLITNIILVDNLISMTVIVGLEISRKYLSYTVSWDPCMGTSKATNSNVVENLGQVEYIVSDKTGTLTKNKMRFKQLSFAGKYYGKPSRVPLEFVDFEDQTFKQAPGVQNVLLSMALCHEAEVKEGLKTSSSSEEICFLHFAEQHGYRFLGRVDSDQHTFYQLEIEGQVHLIKVLNIFSFDFNRKRQSVIVEHQSELYLYSKGADSTVTPLLIQSGNSLEAVKIYSKLGLRTMLFGFKRLERGYYQEWLDRFNKLQMNLFYEESALNQLKEEVERGLHLISVVAIQDQLQDEMGRTLANLREAGVKFWIATGDRSDPVKYLLIQSGEDVSSFIEYNQELGIPTEALGTEHKFLIDGSCLDAFLADIRVEALVQSKKVSYAIVYRCSPIQKSRLAAYLRELGYCVLTIGDGDNDISMLREGDVGVAVRGVEGSQATGVADVVIDQFRQLERLLMVHGRQIHRKVFSLVFLLQFKNVWMGLIEFYFGFINKFTGSPFLESFSKQLYNLVYTLPPLFHLVIYDYEHRPEVLLDPLRRHYRLGIRNMQQVGLHLFYWSLLSLAVPAISCNLLAWQGQGTLQPGGKYAVQLESGYVAMTALVLFANYKAALDMSMQLSPMSVFLMFAGEGIVLVAYLVLTTLFSSSYVYGYDYILRSGWLYLEAGLLTAALVAFDLGLRRCLSILRWAIQKITSFSFKIQQLSNPDAIPEY